MRRMMLALALAAVCASTLICGAGMLLTWVSDGRDLVAPGATAVQISGRGTTHLHVVYTLPPNLRLHSLSQHFEQQGWRRITINNFDRPGPAFARLTWFGTVREVIVVNPRPATRDTADISLARCFRVAGWVACF